MIIGLSIVFVLTAAVALLTCLAPADTAVGFCGTDASFLENFSLGAYRPMLRLASQMDRKFLHSVHSEVLANCYRGIQRNLLREYLREAAKDFSRLHRIVTAKALHAMSDPGDLSLGIFEQQITFLLLVWGIEARLLLDHILPLSFDLLPIVVQLEGLAQQTRQLASPKYSHSAI